jgi:hypothetical protein
MTEKKTVGSPGSRYVQDGCVWKPAIELSIWLDWSEAVTYPPITAPPKENGRRPPLPVAETGHGSWWPMAGPGPPPSSGPA